MKGVHPESVVLAEALQQLGDSKSAKYRQSLIAGFMDNHDPCRHGEGECLEGAIAGIQLRDYLFTLDRNSSDGVVRKGIATILASAPVLNSLPQKKAFAVAD